jgi:hypothetical protein
VAKIAPKTPFWEPEKAFKPLLKTAKRGIWAPAAIDAQKPEINAKDNNGNMLRGGGYEKIKNGNQP